MKQPASTSLRATPGCPVLATASAMAVPVKGLRCHSQDTPGPSKGVETLQTWSLKTRHGCPPPQAPRGLLVSHVASPLSFCVCSTLLSPSWCPQSVWHPRCHPGQRLRHAWNVSSQNASLLSRSPNPPRPQKATLGDKVFREMTKSKVVLGPGAKPRDWVSIRRD